MKEKYFRHLVDDISGGSLNDPMTKFWSSVIRNVGRDVYFEAVDGKAPEIILLMNEVLNEEHR